MKLVPLFDRVVLEQVKAEETTKSGIVLIHLPLVMKQTWHPVITSSLYMTAIIRE